MDLPSLIPCRSGLSACNAQEGNEMKRNAEIELFTKPSKIDAREKIGQKQHRAKQ